MKEEPYENDGRNWKNDPDRVWRRRVPVRIFRNKSPAAGCFHPDWRIAAAKPAVTSAHHRPEAMPESKMEEKSEVMLEAKLRYRNNRADVTDAADAPQNSRRNSPPECSRNFRNFLPARSEIDAPDLTSSHLNMQIRRNRNPKLIQLFPKTRN